MVIKFDPGYPDSQGFQSPEDKKFALQQGLSAAQYYTHVNEPELAAKADTLAESSKSSSTGASSTGASSSTGDSAPGAGNADAELSDIGAALAHTKTQYINTPGTRPDKMSGITTVSGGTGWGKPTSNIAYSAVGPLNKAPTPTPTQTTPIQPVTPPNAATANFTPPPTATAPGQPPNLYAPNTSGAIAPGVPLAALGGSMSGGQPGPPAAPGGQPGGSISGGQPGPPLHSFLTNDEKTVLSSVALQSSGGAKKT